MAGSNRGSPAGPLYTLSKLAGFIIDNSLLLLAGSMVALVWANLDLTGYERIARPLRFPVNDVGMVFFFARAGKEVFEATLPGGPCHLHVERSRLSQRPLAAWWRPRLSMSSWFRDLDQPS